MAVDPPDREGEGNLDRLGHMADGRLAQDWNLVCLTPGPKLGDPKRGWTVDELTGSLSKSVTISAICDQRNQKVQSPVSTKLFQESPGGSVG